MAFIDIKSLYNYLPKIMERVKSLDEYKDQVPTQNNNHYFEITSLNKSIQVLLTVALSIPSAMLLKWLSDKVLMLLKKAIKHFVIENPQS